MKAMKRITTRIAGLALATVMLFGGTSVFAAENYDVVFTDTLYATAERDNIFNEFTYRSGSGTMTVPDTGRYSIYVSSDHDNRSYKEFTAFGNGNVVAHESGNWRAVTIFNVNLEAGVEYTISAYASHFMGRTFANDGIAKFYVEAKLIEKTEEDTVSEISEMPATPDMPEMPYVSRMPDIPEIPEDSAIPAELGTAEESAIPAEPGTSEEPVVPEISTEPEETTVAQEEPVVTTEAVELSTVAERPTARTLTAAELRTLAVRNFVGHLYLDGLGRRAEEAEITGWTDKLMTGSVTATEAATQILTSSELNGHGFDNEQIAAILDEVFGTDAKSDTLAELNSGSSVAYVIEQLAGSDNWASKCAFYGVNV